MAIFDKGRQGLSEHSSPSVDIPRQTVTPSPSNRPTAASGNTALIGETLIITGEIKGDENLVIDGRVEGPIDLQNNTLTVGKKGEIVSDISSAVIEVDGIVKGDITCVDKAVITSTGTVYGNIVAPRVKLEDGAKFQGRIDMIPQDGDESQSSTTTQRENQKKDRKSIDDPTPQVTTPSTASQFKQSKSDGTGLDSLKSTVTEPKKN